MLSLCVGSVYDMIVEGLPAEGMCDGMRDGEKNWHPRVLALLAVVLLGRRRRAGTGRTSITTLLGRTTIQIGAEVGFFPRTVPKAGRVGDRHLPRRPRAVGTAERTTGETTIMLELLHTITQRAGRVVCRALQRAGRVVCRARQRAGRVVCHNISGNIFLNWFKV